MHVTANYTTVRKPYTAHRVQAKESHNIVYVMPFLYILTCTSIVKALCVHYELWVPVTILFLAQEDLTFSHPRHKENVI